MAEQMLEEDMDAQMQDAIAATLGVVDKIDFDALSFDFDQE